MMSCHLGAIVRGQLIGRTKAESAAMQVQHHRTLAAQARRPNVQLQHVLALPCVIPVEKKGLLDAGPWNARSAGSWRRRPELDTRLSRARAVLRAASCFLRPSFGV